MSSAKELSLPLIGTLPQEVEREARTKAAVRTHRTIDEVARCGISSVCGHIITLLLPALLLLQFGTAFAVHDESIAGLQWHVVSFSIGLFTITSFLYHKTLADERITSIAVNLIPEMVTILVIVLIFIRMLQEAFLAMVCGVLFMALIVVASSIHLLIHQPNKVDKVSAEKPVEILIV
jgi:hypothetical protein